MMLPLCTRVTEGRRALIAYSIALTTRRWLPNRDIGSMPRALPSRILVPNWSRRNTSSRVASGLPAAHSTPTREPAKLGAGAYPENTEDAYTGVEYAPGSPEATRPPAVLRDPFRAHIPEGSA